MRSHDRLTTMKPGIRGALSETGVRKRGIDSREMEPADIGVALDGRGCRHVRSTSAKHGARGQGDTHRASEWVVRQTKRPLQAMSRPYCNDSRCWYVAWVLIGTVPGAGPWAEGGGGASAATSASARDGQAGGTDTGTGAPSSACGTEESI
ncbi:hypothetical protein FA95DRAFT_1136388 [Auriscalpium vulgare]|uniref:Uncharacterized protein n=1 Tax=Auriscalpium vulgare TaxID=40419 RepID=A0ACB8R4J1_9AGAM|nr:hypothetical protein FA95DRAFT_1136388 [Auriscalpium vulgare]